MLSSAVRQESRMKTVPNLFCKVEQGAGLRGRALEGNVLPSKNPFREPFSEPLSTAKPRASPLSRTILRTLPQNPSQKHVLSYDP